MLHFYNGHDLIGVDRFIMPIFFILLWLSMLKLYYAPNFHYTRKMWYDNLLCKPAFENNDVSIISYQEGLF